jgi:hypothetical protein
MLFLRHKSWKITILTYEIRLPFVPASLVLASLAVSMSIQVSCLGVAANTFYVCSLQGASAKLYEWKW